MAILPSFINYKLLQLMKTLYLRSLKGQHCRKYSSDQIPQKNSPFHRNEHSIRPFLQSKELQPENDMPSISKKEQESIKFSVQNDKIKRYCLRRFKQIQNLTKNEILLPKNDTSMKHKKEFIVKKKYGSARGNENKKGGHQDQENQKSTQKSTELGKTSTLRQRLQLIKKYRTQQHKENISENYLQNCQEGLSKIENTPIVIPKFVWSQKCLGQGFRKISPKIKILVKNPFEKLMKQHQSIRQFEIQIQKQLEDIPHVEESFVSSVYRKQLQEIIPYI